MLKLAIAVVSLLVLTAQSPAPPAATESSEAKAADTTPATSTRMAPVLVKILPNEKSAADVSREEAREKDAARTETRLADLTGDLARYTRLLFQATAALALLTAGLLGLGAFQAFDNRRSIRASEIAAKAAEVSAKATMLQARAFVGVETVELHNVGVGMAPYAVITLKNSGASPAMNLTETAVMGVDLYPAPQQAPNVQGGVMRQSQPLGPGATIFMTVEFPRPLQAHHIAALNDNTMAIYVFGAMTYTDVFGETHPHAFALFSNSSVNYQGGHMAAFIGDPALNQAEQQVAAGGVGAA